MKEKSTVWLIAALVLLAFIFLSSRIGGPFVYFALVAIAIIYNKKRARRAGTSNTAPQNPNEIIIPAQDINTRKESAELPCTANTAQDFCHNEHFSSARALSEEEKQSERAELKSLLDQGFIEKDEYNEKLRKLY